MKFLLLTALLGVAAADVSHVVSKDQAALIKSQSSDIGPDGTFQWAYETENGISGRASGGLNNPQSDAASQVVQGDAQWTAPNGEVVQLSYVADENGYQPQGSHLPTPPPIPKEILDALEYIRAHPPPPERK